MAMFPSILGVMQYQCWVCINPLYTFTHRWMTLATVCWACIAATLHQRWCAVWMGLRPHPHWKQHATRDAKKWVLFHSYACCLIRCLARAMWTELLLQQGVARPNLLSPARRIQCEWALSLWSAAEGEKQDFFHCMSRKSFWCAMTLCGKRQKSDRRKKHTMPLWSKA